MEREELEAAVRSASPRSSQGRSRALVIGSLGRSGRGAIELLAHAGVEVTAWDREETRTLDREAVLDHDLLVNCVVSDSVQQPFVTSADPTGRLHTIADVTCDVTSDKNLLPINTAITTWAEPVRRIGDRDVIAIDNLPSLLPREASVAFSEDLVRLVPGLLGERGAWAAARAAYDAALG